MMYISQVSKWALCGTNACKDCPKSNCDGTNNDGLDRDGDKVNKADFKDFNKNYF